MAGTIFDSQLSTKRSGSVRFDIAGGDDNAGILRLLRENPMPGVVALSLEREPDYFADAALPGEVKHTIVAHESGRVVCAGNCTVRPRFVNGEKRHVGYLGGLRLDASVAGRFDILRKGYQFFRELQAESPADFYFTSIAADNRKAREFLERGLVGMPVYEWIGDFVTLLIPVPHSKKSVPPSLCGGSGASFIEEICDFLNKQGSAGQLAPCWSPEELAALRPLGLKMENFHVIREDSGMVTCAALWDQRHFRQTVIRGYARWLELARPAINIAATMTRIPRLPVPGSTLAHAFISHFAMVATDRPESFRQCIEAMFGAAREAGVEYVTMGFDANDPRLATISMRFKNRKYHSRIYTVRWPGMGGSTRDLDDRFLCPEVALL